MQLVIELLERHKLETNAFADGAGGILASCGGGGARKETKKREPWD